MARADDDAGRLKEKKGICSSKSDGRVKFLEQKVREEGGGGVVCLA